MGMVLQLKNITDLVWDHDGVVGENDTGDPMKLIKEVGGNDHPRLQEVCHKLNNHDFVDGDWFSTLRNAGVDTDDRKLMMLISDYVFEKTQHTYWVYREMGPIIAEVYMRVRRMHVLSNNCLQAIRYAWGNTLFPLLECAVTFENLTKLKPSPEGLLKISREQEVPPRNILLVDDALNGIEAALSAGTQIAVATWRWQWKNKPFDLDLKQFGRDAKKIIILNRPAELLDIIPKQITY